MHFAILHDESVERPEALGRAWLAFVVTTPIADSGRATPRAKCVAHPPELAPEQKALTVIVR